MTKPNFAARTAAVTALALVSASIAQAADGSEVGFGLFGLLAAKNAAEGKNTLLSPASAHVALGMAYQGARGATQTQMADVLDISGRTADVVSAAMSQLHRDLNVSATGLTVHSKNSI